MGTKAILQQEQADHEETRKKLDLEVQRNASDLSDQEREMQKDDLEAEVKRHMDTKAILQQEQADHDETRKKLDLEVQRNASDLSDQEREMQNDDLEAEVNRHM